MSDPFKIMFVGRLLDAPGTRVRVYAAPGRPPVVVVTRRADRRPATRAALVAAAVELAPALAAHLVLPTGLGLVWVEPEPGDEGRFAVLRFGAGRRGRGRRSRDSLPACRVLDQADVEALLGREIAPAR